MPPASARAQAPPPSSPPGCSLGVHTDRYPCPLCLTVRDTPGLSSRTPCEPAVYLTVGVSRQGGVRTHGSSMPSQPPRPDTHSASAGECPLPCSPSQASTPRSGEPSNRDHRVFPGLFITRKTRQMGQQVDGDRALALLVSGSGSPAPSSNQEGSRDRGGEGGVHAASVSLRLAARGASHTQGPPGPAEGGGLGAKFLKAPSRNL